MTNSFIWSSSQSLTKEFCEHCISKFNSDKRVYEAMAGFRIQTDLKTGKDLVISEHDDWKSEDKVFYESIHSSVPKYQEYVNHNLPYHQNKVEIMKSKIAGDTGYQIQKTEPSQFYDWHSDALVIGNQVRVLTFIWYLNTITEDGYTEFWDGTRIQPEQGKLVIFPATWDFIHRGYPPKSETKYICTGWIHYEV
jgi:hypothetical protein